MPSEWLHPLMHLPDSRCMRSDTLMQHRPLCHQTADYSSASCFLPRQVSSGHQLELQPYQPVGASALLNGCFSNNRGASSFSPQAISANDLAEIWGPFRPLPVLLSDGILGSGWQEKYLVLSQLFSEALEQRKVTDAAAVESRLSYEEFEHIMNLYPCLGKASFRELFSYMDCRKRGSIEETDFISGMLASSPDTPSIIATVSPSPQLTRNPPSALRGVTASASINSFCDAVTTTERDTGIAPLTLIRLQLIFMYFDADGDSCLCLSELQHLINQMLILVANDKRADRQSTASRPYSLARPLGPHFWKVVQPFSSPANTGFKGETGRAALQKEASFPHAPSQPTGDNGTNETDLSTLLNQVGGLVHLGVKQLFGSYDATAQPRRKKDRRSSKTARSGATEQMESQTPHQVTDFPSRPNSKLQRVGSQGIREKQRSTPETGGTGSLVMRDRRLVEQSSRQNVKRSTRSADESRVSNGRQGERDTDGLTTVSIPPSFTALPLLRPEETAVKALSCNPEARDQADASEQKESDDYSLPATSSFGSSVAREVAGRLIGGWTDLMDTVSSTNFFQRTCALDTSGTSSGNGAFPCGAYDDTAEEFVIENHSTTEREFKRTTEGVGFKPEFKHLDLTLAHARANENGEISKHHPLQSSQEFLDACNWHGCYSETNTCREPGGKPTFTTTALHGVPVPEDRIVNRHQEATIGQYRPQCQRNQPISHSSSVYGSIHGRRNFERSSSLSSMDVTNGTFLATERKASQSHGYPFLSSSPPRLYSSTQVPHRRTRSSGIAERCSPSIGYKRNHDATTKDAAPLLAQQLLFSDGTSSDQDGITVNQQRVDRPLSHRVARRPTAGGPSQLAFHHGLSNRSPRFQRPYKKYEISRYGHLREEENRDRLLEETVANEFYKTALLTTTTSTSFIPTQFDSIELENASLDSVQEEEEEKKGEEKSLSLMQMEPDMLDYWRRVLSAEIAIGIIAAYDLLGDQRGNGLCFAKFIEAIRRNDIPGTELLFRTRKDFVSAVKAKQAEAMADLERLEAMDDKKQEEETATNKNLARESNRIRQQRLTTEDIVGVAEGKRRQQQQSPQGAHSITVLSHPSEENQRMSKKHIATGFKLEQFINAQSTLPLTQSLGGDSPSAVLFSPLSPEVPTEGIRRDEAGADEKTPSGLFESPVSDAIGRGRNPSSPVEVVQRNDEAEELLEHDMNLMNALQELSPVTRTVADQTTDRSCVVPPFLPSQVRPHGQEDESPNCFRISADTRLLSRLPRSTQEQQTNTSVIGSPPQMTHSHTATASHGQFLTKHCALSSVAVYEEQSRLKHSLERREEEENHDEDCVVKTPFASRYEEETQQSEDEEGVIGVNLATSEDLWDQLPVPHRSDEFYRQHDTSMFLTVETPRMQLHETVGEESINDNGNGVTSSLEQQQSDNRVNRSDPSDHEIFPLSALSNAPHISPLLTTTTTMSKASQSPTQYELTLSLLQTFADTHERHLSLARRTIETINKLKPVGWKGPDIGNGQETGSSRSTKTNEHHSRIRFHGDPRPRYPMEGDDDNIRHEMEDHLLSPTSSSSLFDNHDHHRHHYPRHLPLRVLWHLCDAVVDVLRYESSWLQIVQHGYTEQKQGMRSTATASTTASDAHAGNGHAVTSSLIYILKSPLVVLEKERGKMDQCNDGATTEGSGSPLRLSFSSPLYQVHSVLKRLMTGREEVDLMMPDDAPDAMSRCRPEQQQHHSNNNFSDETKETPTVILLGKFTIGTRASEALELLGLLFAIKLLYPTKLILLRGSTEDFVFTDAYGLQEECVSRYGTQSGFELLHRIFHVFEFLPICASIERRGGGAKRERILLLTGDVPTSPGMFSLTFNHSAINTSISGLPKYNIPSFPASFRQHVTAAGGALQGDPNGISSLAQRTEGQCLLPVSEYLHFSTERQQRQNRVKRDDADGSSLTTTRGSNQKPLLSKEMLQFLFELVWSPADVFAFNQDLASTSSSTCLSSTAATPVNGKRISKRVGAAASVAISRSNVTARDRHHCLKTLGYDCLIRPVVISNNTIVISFETIANLKSHIGWKEESCFGLLSESLRLRGSESIERFGPLDSKLRHKSCEEEVGIKLLTNHQPIPLPVSQSASMTHGVPFNPESDLVTVESVTNAVAKKTHSGHSSFRHALKSVLPPSAVKLVQAGKEAFSFKLKPAPQNVGCEPDAVKRRDNRKERRT